MIFDGVQTFLSEAGESACYALCILKIAEKYTGKNYDVLKELREACKEGGYIKYNWKNAADNDNFTVVDPVGWLNKLTGARWGLEKVSAAYMPKQGDYIVDRWERQKTGTTVGHFRMADWDSLVDSQTVKYGAIVSRRVFRHHE